MPDDNKEKLGNMLDAIIHGKDEEAQISFHDYLGNKMREEIHGPVSNEDENNEDED